MIPRYEGKRLEYFRKKRKLTQAELAWEAGVSRRSLNRWERQGIPSRWLCVGRVCDVLEIDSKELVSREVWYSYLVVQIHLEDLICSDATVMERNWITCRLSSEILRWEYFWKHGFFGIPENPQAPPSQWKQEPRLKLNTGERFYADEYAPPAHIEVLRKVEPRIYDDTIKGTDLLKLAA